MILENQENSPTLVTIEKRASDSSCVVCTDSPSCPDCADDEQCALSPQTCSSCATMYCAKKQNALGSASSSSSASSNQLSSGAVGGIAGGVSAGVIVVALISMFLLWKFWWKKRRAAVLRNRYSTDQEMFSDKEKAQSTSSPDENKRLSQVTLSTMASTIFTRASNIIPIAYIPGVTIKGSNKHRRGLSRESNFSDLNTLDNASIVAGNTGDRRANMTTAIRARPKLVNIAESEEEKHGEDVPRTAISVSNLGGVKLTPVAAQTPQPNVAIRPRLQDDFIAEVDEEDFSSDISSSDDEDVFIGLAPEGNPNLAHLRSVSDNRRSLTQNGENSNIDFTQEKSTQETSNSDNSELLLDVNFEAPPSNSSDQDSPFDDKFKL